MVEVNSEERTAENFFWLYMSCDIIHEVVSHASIFSRNFEDRLQFEHGNYFRYSQA